MHTFCRFSWGILDILQEANQRLIIQNILLAVPDDVLQKIFSNSWTLKNIKELLVVTRNNWLNTFHCCFISVFPHLIFFTIYEKNSFFFGKISSEIFTDAIWTPVLQNFFYCKRNWCPFRLNTIWSNTTISTTSTICWFCFSLSHLQDMFSCCEPKRILIFWTVLTLQYKSKTTGKIILIY